MKTLSPFLFLLALLACGMPRAADAAPVTVTPTTVVLGPGHTTALVSITNEGDDATRFETNLNTWTESPDGETGLQQSNDVAVFPQLISLAPHETKKIRIGTEQAPASTERSYRLILQELPALNRDTGRVEIQVLSKISMPVFIAPTGARARPAISGATIRDGTLSFDVTNTGPAHFVLRQVAVTGHGASGQSFTLNTNGWYVLAGGRRTYQLALSANDCRKTAEIVIKGDGDAGPVESHVPVSANACGSAAESRFLKTTANSPS